MNWEKKLLFVRSYTESNWYKNLNKRIPVFWKYMEVNDEIKKISENIKNRKLLYITNWYLQIEIENKLEEVTALEILNKFKKEKKWWFNEIKKELNKHNIKVYDYFDEMTFDFDSKYLKYDWEKNYSKLSFNFIFKIITDLILKYDFIYVKKIIFSKYNDFLDYWNFQITLWYDNIVNWNFQIHKIYKKILKLNWFSLSKDVEYNEKNNKIINVTKRTIFDEAMNSKTQLKMKKIWWKLTRDFTEYNLSDRKNVKILEFNFQEQKIEDILKIMKKNNLNIKIDVILWLYHFSKKNIKNSIELKNHWKTFLKNYFLWKLWNQIEVNKKLYILNTLYNTIVDDKYFEVQKSILKKISEYNKVIFDLLEKYAKEWKFNHLTEKELKLLHNSKKLFFWNIQDIKIKMMRFWKNKAKKLWIEKEIKKINEIIFEFLNFYQKKLSQFKIIKSKIKNKLFYLYKNKKYSKIKEIIEKYMWFISKSTFYYIFRKKENTHLIFSTKILTYEEIKEKYFKPYLNTLRKEYKDTNYLDSTWIKKLVDQLKKDIKKEIKFQEKKYKKSNKNKRIHSWWINFFSEKISINSLINKLNNKIDTLEKKLLKKKKLTLKKFFNIIINELDFFKELYKIKWMYYWNFQISYWTIKTLSKKYFFYFKDKFECREKYQRKITYLKNRNERKKRWKFYQNLHNNNILNKILSNLKNNANVNFYEWNRRNCLVYTVWYIKSEIEWLKDNNKDNLAYELESYLDNLDEILWPDFYDFIEESNIDLESLIYSVW